MAEPTERYGLTDTEWVVAEILHRGCWCEAEHNLYADEGLTYDGCGPWSRGGQAREILTAIGGPEPTWRDVIRAARAAGWTSRPDPDQARARIWGVYHPGRFYVDSEHGWARVYGNGTVVDLAGPSDTYAHETVHLINPTPARVLAAARLVGLGGGHG